MTKKVDIQAIEKELMALSLRVNDFLMRYPGATVAEVMGELHISLEEVMAASAYQQRMYQGFRAAQIAQMRLDASEKGKRGH